MIGSRLFEEERVSSQLGGGAGLAALLELDSQQLTAEDLAAGRLGHHSDELDLLGPLVGRQLAVHERVDVRLSHVLLALYTPMA